MLYVTVTQVTESVTYVTVTVTQLYDTEKNIKGSETDNVVQYSNNMLVL